MHNTIRLAALALTLALTACATPYGSRGMFGGFSESRLDANTYRVSFQGNGYTSRQTVESYTMLRCAELTTASGFDWFLVLDSDTERDQIQVQSGTTTQSSTYGASDSWGSISADSRSRTLSSDGGSASWSSTTSTTSPTLTAGINKFESGVVIKMFKGAKPAEAHNGYDAREVLTYLGPQAGLEG